FGMRVIAWSPNLREERAESSGAQLVSKADLFREADFLTVHLVLSPKTRGIVGESELAVMKPSSYLINTSRGPLIEEAALIKALEGRKIAGFAVDVFEHEPLSPTHPFAGFQTYWRLLTSVSDRSPYTRRSIGTQSRTSPTGYSINQGEIDDRRNVLVRAHADRGAAIIRNRPPGILDQGI